MNQFQAMNVLIEAANDWARNNPKFDVTFSIVGTNGYMTSGELVVTHRRRRANISCQAPSSTHYARHESRALLCALDEARRLVTIGYGAPSDGARLEPVWERGQ